MKKILIIGVIILSIFVIYLTTIDKKVYFISLGDEIALGLTQEGYYELNYNDYIKEYLENKNKLETYINDFTEQGKRITDIINDINKNKEIEESKKTIKNALIKADLVTISIGTNDIMSQIDRETKLTKIDYNKIYKNIKKINEDLDKLLNLIREYCKEDIILIGINIQTEKEELNEIINYANELFKETSEKYKITYINQYEKKEGQKIYPTKEEYKKLGERIIEELNNNLLK